MAKYLYKVRNKNTDLYLTKLGWTKAGKSWKRLSDLETQVFYNYQAKADPKRYRWRRAPSMPSKDNIEIVKFEIVEKEIETIDVCSALQNLERTAFLNKNFGWACTSLIDKLDKTDLLNYRYVMILVFETIAARKSKEIFDDMKLALKDMGVKHGADYRYTDTALAFRNAEHATIARLSAGDDVETKIIDLDKLEEIVT